MIKTEHKALLVLLVGCVITIVKLNLFYLIIAGFISFIIYNFNTKKPKAKRIRIIQGKRNYIFKIHNYRCDICSFDETLEIHHKNCRPNDNRTNNLAVLCRRCHKKTHMKDNPRLRL